MTRYVAFLRSINTPPRHVKMDQLRAVFESLRFDNVATVIASGNVVFETDDPVDLVPRIEAALEAALEFDVPTFLRTGTEVREVANSQPFPEGADEVEVSFLATEPDPEAVRALEDTASGADRLVVIGREVYWSHVGPLSDSTHSEARVVRILSMPTTRRSMRTVRRIAHDHLEWRPDDNPAAS